MKRAIIAAVCAASMLLIGCNNPAGLTGRTWFLTSVVGRVPIFQWDLALRDKISYTITFNTDLTYAAKADCNQVSGTYATTTPRGITITPGLSTMAYCGPESHGNLYVGLLAAAKNYTVRLNDLTIETADGGTLNFTSLQPASSESPGASSTATATASASASPTAKPSASPTEKPTEQPTEKPTEQPTSGATGTPNPTNGATATPKPTTAPTATPTSPPSTANGLLGKDWQLTAITIAVPPFQGSVDEAQQPNYTVTFSEDATFSAKADCNTLTGGYTTADATAASGDLTITPGPTTVVACPAGSLSQLYMDALGQATSYTIADNLLTITLVDGGTLQYK
jgi:heat shock protein HslJ